MESWSELAEQAKIDGFTRAIPSGEMPTDGYMVAVSGHEVTIPVAEFAGAHIVRYVADKWDVLTGKGDVYLGAWLADGLVYLDVSECVSSRARALFLGSERKQLAVWDVANGAEVSCHVSAG